jgi:hypothetical protein
VGKIPKPINPKRSLLNQLVSIGVSVANCGGSASHPVLSTCDRDRRCSSRD